MDDQGIMHLQISCQSEPPQGARNPLDCSLGNWVLQARTTHRVRAYQSNNSLASSYQPPLPEDLLPICPKNQSGIGTECGRFACVEPFP